MTDRTAAIALREVAIGYGGEPVVRGVSLTVWDKELHVLLGESGSGKTTILRAIAGFESISAGAIELYGEVVDGGRDGGRGRYRPPEKRRVGVVFQDYALFPHLDVAGNVGFGMRKRDGRRVAELLDMVGLAGLGKRPVAELSGGQQQRVALARALAQEPRIILLDEPFSNLNRQLRDTLRENTAEVLRAQGITAIFVTHDRHEAFALADRVSVIGDGRLLQTGTCRQIYQQPVSEAVARSVGDVTIMNAQVAEDVGMVRCALGAVRVSTEGHTSGDVGADCRIAIRPEQLRVVPGSEVQADESGSSDGEIAGAGGRERGARAMVVRCVYFGAVAEARLRLADGALVHAHIPPGSAAVGDEVRLFVDGRAAVLG